jgi:N-acetylmuramoyl-L-alanine amidase
MDPRAKGRVATALLAVAAALATSGFGFDLATVQAPTGAAPNAKAQGHKVLSGKVITIDPGHNGGNAAHPEIINRQVNVGNGETKECDTTGTATDAGYPEPKYTFAVAKRLEHVLHSHGAKVVLTRDDNHGVGPCIDKRAKIGNKAHSDAAVSIHADGGPPEGRGFHVIYPAKIHGLTTDIYRPSRRLAHALRAAYEKRTGLPRANYIGRNGLDRRDDLGGLRLSDVPKVFIETGNMRNASDARKLTDTHFKKRIAMGIYRGLVGFLKHH